MPHITSKVACYSVPHITSKVACYSVPHITSKVACYSVPHITSLHSMLLFNKTTQFDIAEIPHSTAVAN